MSRSAGFGLGSSRGRFDLQQPLHGLFKGDLDRRKRGTFARHLIIPEGALPTVRKAAERLVAELMRNGVSSALISESIEEVRQAVAVTFGSTAESPTICAHWQQMADQQAEPRPLAILAN